MQLKAAGTINLPDAAGTLFDHGAFEPRSRRVFVAHTARDRVEVIDHDASRHLATLRGFPEAAGVVADDGQVLVTNRGAARLVWVDAYSLEKRAEFKTGLRPNGVAFVSRLKLAVVALSVTKPTMRCFKLWISKDTGDGKSIFLGVLDGA